MRTSSDSRIALFILALGLVPSLIKKSKPLSRYVGNQLIKVGEYLNHGTEEPVAVVTEPGGPDAPPVVVIPEPEVAPEAVTEVVAEEIPESAPAPEESHDATETLDPKPESETAETIEGESHKAWDE